MEPNVVYFIITAVAIALFVCFCKVCTRAEDRATKVAAEDELYEQHHSSELEAALRAMRFASKLKRKSRERRRRAAMAGAAVCATAA